MFSLAFPVSLVTVFGTTDQFQRKKDIISSVWSMPEHVLKTTQESLRSSDVGVICRLEEVFEHKMWKEAIVHGKHST